MLFVLVLGAMLGAATVVLLQQWREAMLLEEREPATLPPPAVARPRGVASAPLAARASRLGGRRAA